MSLLRSLLTSWRKRQELVALLRREVPIAVCMIPFVVGQIVASILDLVTAGIIVSSLLCLFLLKPASTLRGGLAFLGLGILSMLVSPYHTLIPEVDKKFTRSYHYVRGQVLGPFRYPQPASLRFSLRVDDGPEEVRQRSFLCTSGLLPWRAAAKVRPMDYVTTRIKLRMLGQRAKKLSGYEAWLKRRGYSGTCKVSHLAIAHRPLSLFPAIKGYLVHVIRKVTGDNEESGLLLGLFLGVRDQIGRSTGRAFQELGLSHLLVFSGVHVAVFFLGLRWLCEWIVLYGRGYIRGGVYVRLILLILAGFPVLLVVAIAGFEPSATRASVALCVVLLSQLSERRQNFFQSLSLGILILSVIWPGCIAEAGVQLTIAALLGIGLSAGEYKGGIGNVFKTTWACTCFTLPIVWFHFSSVPWRGLIANPLFGTYFTVVGLYGGGLGLLLHLAGIDYYGYILQGVVWLLGIAKEQVWLFFVVTSTEGSYLGENGNIAIVVIASIWIVFLCYGRLSHFLLCRGWDFD